LHGRYVEEGIRIVIRPRQASGGGRHDIGGFRLALQLGGAKPLVADGAPFGPHGTQRYVSLEGEREAYSYVDEKGNTVFASCTLRICTGFRTWRDDYVIEYEFSSNLGRELASVDSSVVQLTETFRPSKALP
jgi:hypothetical protein